MYDNGISGGDEVANDGVFTATLTEYRTNGRKVQFYVEAEAGNGSKYMQPKLGPDFPALYVVDNRKPKMICVRSVWWFRIIILEQ